LEDVDISVTFTPISLGTCLLVPRDRRQWRYIISDHNVTPTARLLHLLLNLTYGRINHLRRCTAK